MDPNNDTKDNNILLTGVKYDQNKSRVDLIPPKVIKDIGDVLAFGARKYAPDNWKHVDDARDRYYGAALRHLLEWREGNKIDKESNLPHIAHALTCLSFITWFDENED